MFQTPGHYRHCHCREGQVLPLRRLWLTQIGFLKIAIFGQAYMLSQQIIHKVGRIDQVVRTYFEENPSISSVPAKDLMPLFVQKGLFNKDYSRPGLPIRKVLRELDKENELS